MDITDLKFPTLKFKDPIIEKAYLLEYAKGLSTQAYVSIVMALILYLSFAYLDLYIVPEHVSYIWTIRAIVAIIFIFVLIGISSKYFLKHNQLIFTIAALAGMGGLFIMCAIISPTAEGRYYVGLMLVIPMLYVSISLRTIYALYLNVILLVTYNIVTAYFKDYPLYIFINNNFFLLGISFISFNGGYLIEKKRREAFYQARTLITLKDKADAANKAKSQFFAHMSHELRTPLTAIIGYSEILLKDIPKEKYAQLKSIESAGNHLRRLIDDILDLAKMDAGKAELHIEETSLSNVLDQLRTTAMPLALKNNNNLIVHIPDMPITMETDSLKLMQILLNLISNACKFTKQGDVVLNAVKQNGNIIFSVQDTGVGMSKEQADKIFQEFQQADSSIPGSYGGTGLGLTISKQLAKLMGGEISVTSEPGKGSTFTVTLPTNI